MSTTPSDAWRDAGLEVPDETTSLVEESSTSPAAPAHEAETDEYRPATPRPDLEGEASEADVAEQASAVPTPDDDE
ncbi:hypothetical protein [Isoptericola croceus]|uniref:hypothetical protein n=1 Tax=Isoptericola croceus TaxID=3031406 RepID=UPI0023F9F5C3|nr:hypothetical protein [Isoptericola croceus]